MKLIGIIVGLLVTSGAGYLLRLPAEDTVPPAQALTRESASPLRWADYGDALFTAGKRDIARQAYDRALELAPHEPKIWVRAANFHFQTNDTPGGVRCAIQALHMVDAFDDILFTYFDRLAPDPAPILAEIGNDSRASRAYTEHLIASGNIDAAQIAWQHLSFKTDPLKNRYIDALLNAHRYEVAHALGCASICNAGFEKEPTGSALDWRIQPSEQFETVRDNTVAHDGTWSLRIRFNGTDNVSYANLSQTVIVRPGTHHLRAWIRSENLTTNEGPRLEVLNARTEPISGTHDWMPIDLSFSVLSQPSSAVQIRVVRTPSMKFDNKIEGTLWLDSLTLQ